MRIDPGGKPARRSIEVDANENRARMSIGYRHAGIQWDERIIASRQEGMKPGLSKPLVEPKRNIESGVFF